MSQECGGGDEMVVVARYWGDAMWLARASTKRFPLRTAVNTEDVGMRQRTLSESEKRQRSQLPVASTQ